MRALSFVAIGLTLAAFDFRTEAIDLLADPLGWGLVSIGAYRLRLTIAVCGAAAATILSFSEAYLSFRYITVDPVTAEPAPLCETCPGHLQYDDVGQLRAVAIAFAVVLGSAAIVSILHRLRRHVGRPNDFSRLRHHMRILELLVPVTWALPYIVLVGLAVAKGERYDPVWNGLLEYLALLALLVLAWTVATIARFSHCYPRPLAAVHAGGSDAQP